MKYVIVGYDKQTPYIEGITENPAGFIMQCEPIDVINGEIVAWDENGNSYHFSTDSPVDLDRKGFINVGKWLEGEPRLTLVKKDHLEELRETLITCLNTKTEEKKYWWSRKPPASHSLNDRSNMSIADLFNEVEHI